MNFSKALELIKNGERLTRTGWNGAGMFVYFVMGSTFLVNRAPLNEIFPTDTPIKYRPHIDLKAADGTCGVWSPNNTDILADDWEYYADKA
jgi:Protein of unknown function (DUF2829)